MSNVNTVIISGNLTRDPELRHTPSGTAICQLGVAVNKSRKLDSGEYEDKTSFFDVDVWSGFGELAARKLSKGDLVTIQGELEQQRWESEGGNRSKVVIVARQIDGAAMYKVTGTSQGEPLNAGAPAVAAAQASTDDIPF